MTEPARPQPATNVRLIILFLTTLVAVLLYLDRICLSFAELYVTEDLNLTKDQMALVLSSFFVAYAVAQVPSGWLSDRYGARIMLTIYLAAWSLCTGLMGLAYGFVSLMLLRLGCGLFEAGAYPTCAGLIRKWIPFARRGLASGLISVGGRLGGATAPLLTAYLMVAFVPLDSSSTLSNNDILPGQRKNLVEALHNPDAYIKTLEGKVQGKEKPEDVTKRQTQLAILKRVAERLPSDTTEYLRRMSTFGVSDDEMPDEELSPLVTGLNEVLSQGDLLNGIELKHLDLAQSTRNLVEKSNASKQEVERRNRFVLEATMPTIVRKLIGAGWRPVMIIYGAAGILVALLFYVFFRNSPRQHPKVNAAEVALIEGNDPPSTNASAIPPSFPWKAVLESRSLWLVSAVQFLTNFAWAFLITWFPRYLAEEHRVPIEVRGWMTFLPLAVGIAGMFLGGLLTDWTTHRFGLKRGRQWPIAGSRFLAGAAFLVCLLLDTPWPVTLAMAVVAFATDLGTPAMWAYSLDVGGKNTGAVLGWSNMWGNLGAFASPLVLNLVLSNMGPPALFIVCGSGFMLAGILSMGVDATRPLVVDAEASSNSN